MKNLRNALVAVGMISCTLMSYAQSSQSNGLQQNTSRNLAPVPKGAGAEPVNQKAEPNGNPAPTTEAMPVDFPTLDLSGNPGENFYNYIQEKSSWFAKNPEYLQQKRGLTRVSKNFIDQLPQYVQAYVQSHITEFEILGQ